MGYKHNRNEKAIRKFGERVRALREEKGISQHELARLCGLEHSQINRIELGKVNTNISLVVLIAEALNISLSELWDFEI